MKVWSYLHLFWPEQEKNPAPRWRLDRHHQLPRDLAMRDLIDEIQSSTTVGARASSIIDQNQRKSGMMEGFIYEGLCTNSMTEENQDPGYMEQSGTKENEQDYFKTHVKEENLDPDYPSQLNNNIKIKKEIPDLGYFDHNKYRSGVKEENQGPEIQDQEYTYNNNQDHNTCGEKIQDADFGSSDLSIRSKARFPPGPDVQVSIYRSPGSRSDLDD